MSHVKSGVDYFVNEKWQLLNGMIKIIADHNHTKC